MLLIRSALAPKPASSSVTSSAVWPAGCWPSLAKVSRQRNLSGSMTPYRYFIHEAWELMCQNKHCAAASKFLLLQLLKDFLQVLFYACYLEVSWLSLAGFFWYVTLPEDTSFSELPLQKDAPQSPGTPIKPTSCFGVFSWCCSPSAGLPPSGVAVPFGYPSTLLVALLHQQILDCFQVSG